MRELSLTEIELIAGTFDTTAWIPDIGPVSGPSYTPSSYYPPPSTGGSAPAPTCGTPSLPPCHAENLPNVPSDLVDLKVDPMRLT